MSDLGPADLAAYLSAAVFLLLAGQWIAAARTQPDEQAKRYAIGFALCMGGGLVARAPATLTALGGSAVARIRGRWSATSSRPPPAASWCCSRWHCGSGASRSAGCGRDA